MKLFFLVLVAISFPFSAQVALAGGKRPCNTAGCEAYQTGIGSGIKGPAKCTVLITAPTPGGLHFYEPRDTSRKSLFDEGKPRTKMVRGHLFSVRVGCHWLLSPTAEFYLCVDGDRGGSGGQFSSVRLAETGDLERAVWTGHLKMCLGPNCPDYIGGQRPPLQMK
ncbi:MAG: hypothetical protein UY70_C0014G0010 [Candidatus Kaiserbacteria bacterium GW2011_GWB1_52_6]|uniref:Uncharacterized protein n=1 Tax=Candidatus Kaiserbacteria bacterium GW2011_GWB1_52_6 TaxID=1618674 RepID=A0A0G1X9B8_9BACT|nr:MAG: hypothetical protein UY70_C0014G0010 [Candidatus Kaiserbacteria bacterium GW2011_GWB1_52_6]